MNAIKHGCIVLALLPLFLVTGIVGGAFTIVGSILLALPILLNARSHRKYVASLPADYEEDCSSTEFGPTYDLTGDILKAMLVFPMTLAICLGEVLMEHARATIRLR